ncbi:MULTISPECIES: hypothetical protein [Bacillus]|uniref:hypothetical protein n=1 Tax=Bacillus TaxID=1386 RepID=UPI0024163425|nr:hypothetical protein [Bacillus subtilis]MED3670271.1 hypothetical protein [Bacillus subtilis]WFO97854.1 hypothetical protein JEQ25_12550 [Bacillus subtilis]
MKYAVFTDYGPDADPMLFESYEDAYEDYNHRVKTESRIASYLCVVIGDSKRR